MTSAIITKERPILFSRPMVRAILDGKKTQTRRVVKRQCDMEFDPADPHFGPYWLSYATEAEGEDAKVRCPYGEPGDRLWVRETFYRWTGCGRAPERFLRIGRYQYCYADDPEFGVDRQRAEQATASCVVTVPSIFMPRLASRIALEITGVRVERLTDISEKDAQAEGAIGAVDQSIGNNWCAREAFLCLWESINGEGSWDANPWVWVVEFRQISTPK